MLRNVFYGSLCFVLLVLIPFTTLAQGDLLIFPKRIVFEGADTGVKTVHLTNNGPNRATYDISYLELGMLEDGRMVRRNDLVERQHAASPHLRVFPRRVTLGAGESQVVKVQWVDRRGLDTGEYRSHLYFRSVPNEVAGRHTDTDAAREDDIAIRLNYVFGITIANIIRVGRLQLKVDIVSFRLLDVSDGKLRVDMDFERKGNVSSYGYIVLEYVSPKGRVTELKRIKGFAIYTPGNFRRTMVEMDVPEGIDLGTGELRVSYVQHGDGQVYAVRSLQF